MMTNSLFMLFQDWEVIFSNNNIDDIIFPEDEDEKLEMTINEDIEFISECS